MIYKTYLEPYFLQNQEQIDHYIVYAKNNAVFIIRQRLAFLLDFIQGRMNKMNAQYAADGQPQPTSPVRAVMNLWNTFGSRVISQHNGQASVITTADAEHREVVTPSGSEE
ncbi:hypothetical protein FISHEDRAFT_76330 [Fistulina hepatica ATCC 64428]|uniref:Uncharacterized protein n=1 Tax=Fistulina hepatica ATCC 64428 TaxID=1128425 RepID=A0A0D7A425_9AGAR|nr:hypothetical protein FISHEDRAFT_76330 [Fistulina hepatica ATCC 64428]